MEVRNKQKLAKLLDENKDIFWHFNKNALTELSDAVIVEYFLNYGTQESIKALFDIMGIDHVAEVFYEHTAPGRRINYFPRTKNFFELYFAKHAQRNIKQRAS